MSEQQILKEFEIMETGSKFISDNFNMLQTKYGNKFIAVKSNKVIADSQSFAEIVKKAGSNPLSNEIIIQFITQKGDIILY